MLKELKILNGTLELDFNEYTYEYTVVVDDEIKELEFEYTLTDNSFLVVSDNYLDDYENIVYVDVYNGDSMETYTFYVYKESTNVMSGIENYKKSIEVKKEEVIPLYKLQLLSIGVSFSIIIVFSIIFHRRKTKA